MLSEYQVMLVKDINDLSISLDGGLVNLYKNCFSVAPYYEHYTKNGVVKIFENYLDKEASILVLFDQKKVVGFSVKAPMKNFPEVVELVSPSVADVTTCLYDADIAIDINYRSKGLSSFLEKSQACRLSSYYDYEITRTSAYSYIRIASNLKHGKRMLPHTDQGTILKVDGSTYNYKGIYFKHDFKNKSIVDLFLKSVKVMGTKEGDLAVVFDQVPVSKRFKIKSLIQKNYPGIFEVGFADSDSMCASKDCLFLGQMPLVYMD